MRFENTVKKIENFFAKEPELRERYRKAMETLQVDLPPLDDQLLPYRKPDDLFRTARKLQQGADMLGDIGGEIGAVAASTQQFAITQKAKIKARRDVRDMADERADEIIDLLNAVVADAIDMLHHLKRLSKIENNPDGYYTQQYRQLLGAYRESMHNLHGGKARGRSRKKARAKFR